MFYNRNIFVVLSYQCNAFCKKCMTRFHTNIGNSMKRSTLDTLAKILKTNNYKGLISVGTGEPFLYEDLSYFIHEILSINDEISIRILTNGTTLTTSLPEKLFQGRCKIGVTFDGFAQSTIEKIQTNIQISDVKSNIAKVIECYNPDVFYLNYTVYQHNIDELLEFCKFAVDLGIKEVYATELKIYEGYENELNDYRVKTDDVSKNIITEAKNLLENFDINGEAIDIFQKKQRIACYARNIASPIIDFDGSVSFCCGREDVIVGNIADENIQTLWSNKLIEIKRNTLSWCDLCHDTQLSTGLYRLPSTIYKRRKE